MLHAHAGLDGYTDDASPESLITCILKVDLGGCLGERSWLHGAAAAVGLVDSFMERMLTSVILIKDEVEQQRFKVGVIDSVLNTSCYSSWLLNGQQFVDAEAVRSLQSKQLFFV